MNHRQLPNRAVRAMEVAGSCSYAASLCDYGFRFSGPKI